jgi:hypothetical protein
MPPTVWECGSGHASLTPYHVARSELFVRERSQRALVHLDTAEIEASLDHARLPVPTTSDK